MANTAQVLKALKDFLDIHIRICFTGKVLSVNEDYNTCEVEHNDLVYECKLKASADGGSQAFVIYPIVGSYVFCVNENNSKNRYCVLMVDKIDKIVINGGENGGLVIAPNLVDRLNAIENAFNDLLNNYKTHVHTSAAPGSPTTPITPVVTMGTIGTTELGDIENIKIKH